MPQMDLSSKSVIRVAFSWFDCVSTDWIPKIVLQFQSVTSAQFNTNFFVLRFFALLEFLTHFWLLRQFHCKMVLICDLTVVSLWLLWKHRSKKIMLQIGAFRSIHYFMFVGAQTGKGKRKKSSNTRFVSIRSHTHFVENE